MSQERISRSPDLKRLRDAGYDIALDDAFLLIRDVPYVNTDKEVKRGTLASELTLAGDVTTVPKNHVVYFVGDYPCNRDGQEIGQIRHKSVTKTLTARLVVNHSFSSRPVGGRYQNYYDKMTTYIAILSHPAQAIDSSVTAITNPAIETEAGESVFHYFDTASSRAEISVASQKLELDAVAIVGMGGTGSYILDLVAKTPVRAIHIFDGDTICNHNAFRSPGAPSLEELRSQPRKVTYFQGRYSQMHRQIIAHDCFVDADTVDQLRTMTFVFLALDRGDAKRLILQRLEEWGIPFVDAGMGVELVNDALTGILRVTSGTEGKRSHIWQDNRIPFSVDDGDDAYGSNVQIADLNSLSAALAVIRWKKIYGFYHDFENENHSLYLITGNTLLNEVFNDGA